MKFTTLNVISDALSDAYYKRMRDYDNAHDELYRLEKSFLAEYGQNWENRLNAQETAEYEKVKDNNELFRIAFQIVADAQRDFREHNFR